MTPEAEALASFVEFPKKRGAAGGDGATPALADEPDTTTTPERRPTITDVSPRVRFNTVEQLVRSQDRLAKNRWNIDQFHDWAYRGVPFGRLEKIPNQSLWVSKL